MNADRLNTEQQANEGRRALANALQVSFRLLRVVMILLLLSYISSGIFIVHQHEKAFVLLFGKIAGSGQQRVLGPGLHWTFPPPFAEIVRIPTERVQSIESDSFWYFITERDRVRGTEPKSGNTLDPLKDGYALSGDANLLHSRWVLRYTVRDPERYAFGLKKPAQILRDELDHAVVKTSIRFSVDKALRTDIEAFRAAVDSELRRRCRELNMGIEIQRVDLLAVQPPRQVAAAFDAVVEAEQDSSRQISEARASASRALNESRGEAARLVAQGEAYKKQLISEASANADYFDAVYEKYVKHPRITARTILQDTLRRALANVEEKYIVYRAQSGEQEIRLLLSPKSKNTLE